MVRFAREKISGDLIHVWSNFVNDAFRIRTDADRLEYLRRAGAAFERSDCQPLAFALMSSHIHWAFLGHEKPLSRVFQSLHGGFASYLNRSQGTSGPVFAQRYNQEGDRDGLSLIAYIHNNPVEARVVTRPELSAWTSHRAYLGLEDAPPWLHVSLGLELCGFSQNQRDLFGAAVAEQERDPRSTPCLPAVRAQLRKEVGAPVELGLGRQTESGLQYSIVQQRSVAEVFVAPQPLERVLECVVAACGISWPTLRRQPRTHHATKARRLALLLWEKCGGQQAEMARALGIGESAASQLLKRSRTDSLQAEVLDLAKSLHQ